MLIELSRVQFGLKLYALSQNRTSAQTELLAVKLQQHLLVRF